MGFLVHEPLVPVRVLQIQLNEPPSQKALASFSPVESPMFIHIITLIFITRDDVYVRFTTHRMPRVLFIA